MQRLNAFTPEIRRLSTCDVIRHNRQVIIKLFFCVVFLPSNYVTHRKFNPLDICGFQKKQVVRKQGGKRKKTILKFTLDCTHPVEDGIMDAANFVSRAAG